VSEIDLSDQPEFAKPPVTEVVLSVQFEPIQKLTGPQIGLVWTRFRSQFPRVEEHPPIARAFEVFGKPGPQQVNVQFELTDSLPMLRSWFLNDRGDQLIQVQQDRFIHNWRKVGDEDEYPRYKRLIASFTEELVEFGAFLKDEGIGDLALNQCEVTYVNHIIAGEGWEAPGELNKVLTVWSGTYSDEFLSEPEDVRLAIRYTIPSPDDSPLGRLHISAAPAFRMSDKKGVLVLTLTARCRPLENGLEGVKKSLDLAHNWMVRGFASITTRNMHQIWERRK
jgi:uncharacterized protein (TIGR04255 family)